MAPDGVDAGVLELEGAGDGLFGALTTVGEVSPGSGLEWTVGEGIPSLVGGVVNEEERAGEALSWREGLRDSVRIGGRRPSWT